MIDSEYKSLGIDPNWQREQILAQASAARNRASQAEEEADRNNREFVEHALTSIPIPRNLREMATQPDAHRDPTFLKQLKMHTNYWVSMKGSMEAEKMEAELLDVKDKDKAKKLGTSYNQKLQTGVYSAVLSSIDWKNFQESSRKVQAQANAGEVVSSGDQEALRASFAAVRNRMNEHRLSVKAEFAENAGIFTKEMGEADKLFDDMLDGFEKGLNDPSTGLLSYNIAALEGRIKGKQFDLTKNSEQARGLAAARQLYGDIAIAEAVRLNGDKALDPLKADIQNNAIIDAATGKEKSLIGTIRKIVSDPRSNTAEDVGNAVDGTISLFANPNTRPEGKKALAGVLFHGDNKQFFDQMLGSNLTDQQKRDYVTKFASPVMYNEIKKLNDPTALNSYRDVVAYAAARLNRETANTINDIKEFASFKDITYNPATRRLEVSDRSPGGSTPAAEFTNKLFSYIKSSDKTAEEAANNVNKALEMMTPIWNDLSAESGGRFDVQRATQGFIQQMGINTNIEKKGNILERGIDLLKDPERFIRGSQGKDKAGGNAGEDVLGESGSVGGDPATALSVGAAYDQLYETSKAQYRDLKQQLDGAVGDPDLQKIIREQIRGLEMDFYKQREEIDKVNDQLKGSESRDKLRGDPGQDILDFKQAVTNPGPGEAPVATEAPYLFSSRVEDTLVESIGVEREQARKVAGALGTITGVDSVQQAIDSGDPRKIAQEAALAALTLIPGSGTGSKVANEAVKKGLDVVKGGLSKLDDLKGALPKMGDSELTKQADSLFKRLDELGVDKQMLADKGSEGNLIVDQLNAITQEWASRLDKLSKGKAGAKKVFPTPDDLVNGETFSSKLARGEFENVPLTKETWNALEAEAKAVMNKNIVSLVDIRASKEARKVADENDAKVKEQITKGLDTFTESMNTVVDHGNKVYKDLPRLYKLAEQLDNKYIATDILDFVKMQDAYGAAAERTRDAFKAMMEFPSNTSVQRKYERAYETQKKFEQEIVNIVGKIDAFKDSTKPKRIK